MADPRLALLYRNLGIDADWSASSQVSTLPARNLATENRNEPWRSTGCASEWIKAHLAGPAAVGAVAIVSGNLTASATVRVQANASDDWSAPPFDVALTPWVATRTGVLFAMLASVQTYEWWRLTFADATNTDGYIEIGVLPFGPVFDLGEAPEAPTYRRIDPSLVEVTDSQTPHRYRKALYAEVEVPLGLLTRAVAIDGLAEAFDDLGQSTDGVLSVYSTDPAQDGLAKRLNLYGSLTTPLELVYDHVDQWRDTLTFRESL